MVRVLLALFTVALLSIAVGCGGTTDSIPTAPATPPKGGPSMMGGSTKPVELNPPPMNPR